MSPIISPETITHLRGEVVWHRHCAQEMRARNVTVTANAYEALASELDLVAKICDLLNSDPHFTDAWQDARDRRADTAPDGGQLTMSPAEVAAELAIDRIGTGPVGSDNPPPPPEFEAVHCMADSLLPECDADGPFRASAVTERVTCLACRALLAVAEVTHACAYTPTGRDTGHAACGAPDGPCSLVDEQVTCPVCLAWEADGADEPDRSPEDGQDAEAVPVQPGTHFGINYEHDPATCDKCSPTDTAGEADHA